MNTAIHFRIDRGVLRDLGMEEIAGADAADLAWRHFVQPITIVVGGETMASGAYLPLIKLAYYDLQLLRSLPGRENDEIIFPPGGGLRLQIEGSDVIVAFPERDRIGRAPYAELLGVWERFSDCVRAFLLEEFPDFRSHPTLGPWFRGEEG